MATLKQKKLAKNIVLNSEREEPLNKKELVVSSGYSEISAESSAHIIIDQKGVQEELSNLGFTEDNAKRVVSEILLDETKDANSRLKASDMIFKVHGTYAPDKHVSLNLNQDVESPELIDLAKTLNELKRNNTTNGLTGNGTISSPVDREIQD